MKFDDVFSLTSIFGLGGTPSLDNHHLEIASFHRCQVAAAWDLLVIGSLSDPILRSELYYLVKSGEGNSQCIEGGSTEYCVIWWLDIYNNITNLKDNPSCNSPNSIERNWADDESLGTVKASQGFYRWTYLSPFRLSSFTKTCHGRGCCRNSHYRYIILTLELLILVEMIMTSSNRTSTYLRSPVRRWCLPP